MNEKLIILIGFFISIYFQIVASAEVTNSGARIYTTKGDDSAQLIASEFLPSHKMQYGDNVNEYIKDLKKWNPQITNWDHIPEGSELYIDVPITPHIGFQYAPKLGKKNVKPVSEFLEDTQKDNSKNQLKLLTMVTLSQASFKETVSSGSLGSGNFESTQNSPMTIGLGANYLLNGVKDLLSTSAYWSYISPSNLSGNSLPDQQVRPSPEIGANLYYQSFLKRLKFSIYEGIDFEKFSTLNTKHFAAGDNLAVYSNNIVFATIGLGEIFYFLGRKTLLKISISQTIFSRSSGTSDDAFKGQRALIFASIRGVDKFSYHLLYKRHMLKGPTNLTIDRIGIGLGYEFF